MDKVPRSRCKTRFSGRGSGVTVPNCAKEEIMSQRYRVIFQIFFCKIFPRPLCIIGSCV